MEERQPSKLSKALERGAQLAVIVGAGVAAWVGINALHASRDANKASKEANSRAEKSFDASIRPLITALTPPLTLPNSETPSCHRHHGAVCVTKEHGGWVLSIPVENVGPGVALIPTKKMTIYAQTGSRTRTVGTIGPIAGIPSGETIRIQFAFKSKVESHGYHTININYTDVAGHQSQCVQMVVLAGASHVHSEKYLH
jgi:hypothetical protein